jgi:hypothetical protein
MVGIRLGGGSRCCDDPQQQHDDSHDYSGGPIGGRLGVHRDLPGVDQ